MILWQLALELPHHSGSMAAHPKSRIIALRALLAVVREEEQKLLKIINSDQTSPEEISKALNELHKLWSIILLKVADLKDATATSSG